ncbi:MAG: aconitate hydratase AcnA, partial [Desulfobacterales bacterium]|nr:aconitate hydratase AcnA [Desulfobacterales bacterium]
YERPVEIPYHPARVLMQDFTGVPAVVDLAAMRDAVKAIGKDPGKINPMIPVDLVIDHSLQMDYYGSMDAVTRNLKKEYQRNTERYTFLKWAQKSFENFRVVPPNSGICHQVNLEHLAQVVMCKVSDGKTVAFPDTLLGTDSHTTMINGIGVMGWGVGGIEAEAVMLGQPYYMTIPEVVGVRLTGQPPEGITATDIVLAMTEMLRAHKVVEKFVEYFGPGIGNLSVTDRATIANMAPEYGATLGFFPVDNQTLEYLELTGRSAQAALAGKYTRAQGLFYTGENDPDYSQVLDFDLSAVAPSVAGPARPQDRIELKNLKTAFAAQLAATDTQAASTASASLETRPSVWDTTHRKTCHVDLDGQDVRIGNGSIVIAAITSCTNTSNPNVVLGAGLVAKNAVRKGLRVSPHVKTTFAPGSRTVGRYVEDAGLMPYLEALGFHLSGFGCATCIGNSGALHPGLEKAITDNGLTVASVLSGNRNFEARIHQRIKANFLMSPMLVVAFAIAGRIDIDLTTEPVGFDPNGTPVYLKDLWPSNREIRKLVHDHVTRDGFETGYHDIFAGDRFWQALAEEKSTTFPWDEHSTYIKHPPYFENFDLHVGPCPDIHEAKPLLMLGDSVTTDHISPAGAIPAHYPAGQYLTGHGLTPEAFNTYGSRRGNHEVMMRGTFANIRIKNQLAAPSEGGYTRKFPEKEKMFIFDAADRYRHEDIPLIVLGGKEYGTGSSRDWAAKGTLLLGIKAVIAESYERIHRSNLVGMGVLPLIFTAGQSWRSLGLNGSETFFIDGIDTVSPGKVLQVTAGKTDGSRIRFEAIARLDTQIDVEYFKHGGILPYVLRKLIAEDSRPTPHG